MNDNIIKKNISEVIDLIIDLVEFNDKINIFENDNNSIYKKSKRKISINDNNNEIFMIPTKKEIIEDNLKEELWWNGNDFRFFHATAAMELQTFMQINPHLDIKILSRILWLEVDFDEIYRKQQIFLSEQSEN